MTDYSGPATAPLRDPYDDQIDIVEWLGKFRGQRRLIIGAACAGVLSAAVAGYAFPPGRVATARLIVERRSDAEPSAMANYRRGLESPTLAQRVVSELGLDKASPPMSAEELRSRTTITTTDAAGIATIEIRANNPDLATAAATSLARHGVESARAARERERIQTNLGFVLRLRQQLPELLAEIQGYQTGLQIVQGLNADSARSDAVQGEKVLGRVRIAQQTARWEHIVSGISAASALSEKVESLPPGSVLPASIVSEYEALAARYGVAVGERDQVPAPLRILSETTLSEPPGLRQMATNLALGFVLGLLVAVAISFAYYVVFTARRPGMPRPTPE